jgi:hypothetical protein
MHRRRARMRGTTRRIGMMAGITAAIANRAPSFYTNQHPKA